LTWDRAVDVAQIVTAIGAALAVLVAVWVAFFVAAREDRRQRESERRAVQRQYVVDLQDAWLTQDRLQGEAIHAIQLHSTSSQYAREALDADLASQTSGELPGNRAAWPASLGTVDSRSDGINKTGADMVASILARREHARHIELLESRVVSDAVKQASLDMRLALERMEWVVGNRDVQGHQPVKEREYGPAFQRFIDAGYRVLADLEPYVPESDATRRRRQAATRIASSRPWDQSGDPTSGDSH
jgi:hypothetical protein